MITNEHTHKIYCHVYKERKRGVREMDHWAKWLKIAKKIDGCSNELGIQHLIRNKQSHEKQHW